MNKLIVLTIDLIIWVTDLISSVKSHIKNHKKSL